MVPVEKAVLPVIVCAGSRYACVHCSVALGATEDVLSILLHSVPFQKKYPSVREVVEPPILYTNNPFGWLAILLSLSAFRSKLADVKSIFGTKIPLLDALTSNVV